MDIRIREMRFGDGPQIVGIMNYFVEHSMASYGDEEMGPEVFENFKKLSRYFLVLETQDKIIGFGLIQHYRPLNTLKHTGLLTYFILPQYTGQGLGTRLLNQLFDGAKERGITNLVAHISSENQQSFNFHKKHGFQECGTLRKIGYKFDKYFDIIWVQKFL